YILHRPLKAGQQDIQELADKGHAVAVDAEQVREVPEEGAGVQDFIDDGGGDVVGALGEPPGIYCFCHGGGYHGVLDGTNTLIRHKGRGVQIGLCSSPSSASGAWASMRWVVVSAGADIEWQWRVSARPTHSEQPMETRHHRLPINSRLVCSGLADWRVEELAGGEGDGGGGEEGISPRLLAGRVQTARLLLRARWEGSRPRSNARQTQNDVSAKRAANEDPNPESARRNVRT
ncbi:hypothetical protein V494_05348, partial [Pseudogymnoascus sp. VKM F-4513 (FW-928)]